MIKFIYLSLVLPLMLSLGCTREGKNDASIELASSNGSLSLPNDYKLTRIMVNVRGPGISTPIFYVWNGRGANDVILPAPSSVSLSVPSGSERLIQYLAVYSNDSDITVFYYGDRVTSLTSGANPVEITAFKMNTGSTETTMAGRYIRANSTFPTGKVRIEVVPPTAGRPKMIVDKTEIFGGWMSFFTYPGVPFSYVMDDGSNEMLFDSVTSAAVLGTTGPSRLHAVVPEHFNSQGGVCDSSRRRARMDYVFGYFGPGSSGKKVCYDDDYSGPVGIFAVVNPTTCGSEINWSSSYVSPASNSPGAVIGGYGATDTAQVPSCSTELPADQIMFPHEKLHLGGKDRFISRGPFKVSSGDGISLDFSGDDLTDLELNWAYVPDATGTNAVAGLDIFKRPSNFPNREIRAERFSEGGFMNCSEAAVKAGYGFVASVDAGTTTHTLNGTVAADDHNLDGDFNQGDYQFVLCPFSTSTGVKTYYSSLAETYEMGPVAFLSGTGHNFGSVSPGATVDSPAIIITNNGTAAATGITFSSIASPFSLQSSNCPATLPAGASCDIVVRFSAPAGSGTRDLLVNYAGGTSPQLKLTFQGVSGP